MNNYCKIFVNTGFNRRLLVYKLSQYIAGRRERYTVENDSMIIDVRDNKECKIQKIEHADCFLFYKYYLDIESKHGIDINIFKKEIKNILHSMKQDAMMYVVTCDFEDELKEQN